MKRRGVNGSPRGIRTTVAKLLSRKVGHANLLQLVKETANAGATIEVGAEKFNVVASEAKGAQRDRLYDAQAKLYPGFKDYELKTTRKIPVFVLKQA